MNKYLGPLTVRDGSIWWVAGLKTGSMKTASGSGRNIIKTPTEAGWLEAGSSLDDKIQFRN